MSTDDTRDPAATIRELVSELEGTALGERMHDPEFRRRHAYGALQHNPDPIMREIGQQLRDGSMRPADVLRVPAYAEAFLRSTEDAARRLEPKKIAAELSALLAEQRRAGRSPRDATENGRDR